jgi:hypothetical protein
VILGFRREEDSKSVFWYLQVFGLKFLAARPVVVWPNDSQGAVEQFEVCLSVCQKRTALSAVLCMDVASKVFPGRMSLHFALSALCPVFLANRLL